MMVKDFSDGVATGKTVDDVLKKALHTGKKTMAIEKVTKDYLDLMAKKL